VPLSSSRNSTMGDRVLRISPVLMVKPTFPEQPDAAPLNVNTLALGHQCAKFAQRSHSLIAQGLHGIETRGTTRRQIRGDERGGEHDRRHQQMGHRLEAAIAAGEGRVK
jgi:hypothetical protein